MKVALGAIKAERKTGREPFLQHGQPLPFDLLRFWQWAASDLLSNATRGIVAEYLVAQDIGMAHGVRAEWDAYDVVTEDGVKVEVKAAAYLQSWYQEQYSQISFRTCATHAWDASTNKVSQEQKRQADVYVFCLLDHKDQQTGYSEGLTALWKLGRLDITMEALVLQQPWSQLFTAKELVIARRRLQELGYTTT